MSESGCCVDKRLGGADPCTETTCMKLPREQTCTECAHFGLCAELFSAKAENTACDFFPRRFKKARDDHE